MKIDIEPTIEFRAMVPSEQHGVDVKCHVLPRIGEEFSLSWRDEAKWELRTFHGTVSSIVHEISPPDELEMISVYFRE